MSTLRSMVDGVGSLQLNVPTVKKNINFVKNQDVVIRRQTSRTGPVTHEMKAGKIISINQSIAVVAVKAPGGATVPQTVNIKELAPATEEFKRRSVQFNPQHRQSW